MSRSRVVPGRYPAPGSSPVADRIRERRGERGLTALDGTLLHVPPVADGWNSLLGAIRTKGKLSGDVRELMILRVAAINKAAYEWIHHEHVGRSHGLDTSQLRIIRDLSGLPSSQGTLNGLQLAALRFADQSTRSIQISSDVQTGLRQNIGTTVNQNEDETDDLLVEAAAVVSVYNMVSRFLVSLDVAGASDEPVPWPADKHEVDIPLPDHPGHHLHVVTLTTDSSLPWLIFSNSLLTNTSMWDHLLPYALENFNVVLHDQRGHGQSTTPPAPCTIPLLARDIALVLDHLNLAQVHAVIGVSQGGAAALSFGMQFPTRTKFVVSCDTGPRTLAGNKEAWKSRIELAKEKGVGALAEVTATRWFPAGIATEGRMEWVKEMITKTELDGFSLGAGALMEYDLIQGGLLESKAKTLLVAGSLDGDGKVAQGMTNLAGQWKEKGGQVEMRVVNGSGHLPMIDNTEKFWLTIKPSLLEA